MELLYKELTGKIVDCSISVHGLLGPGLLESAYEECLQYELSICGLKTLKQLPMPLVYKAKKLDIGYRIDLLIEDRIIVEVKSVDAINPIHMAGTRRIRNKEDRFVINYPLPGLPPGGKVRQTSRPAGQERR